VSVRLEDYSVDAAALELKTMAEPDDNKCCGYFPAMHADGINMDLPASKAFAETYPEFEVDGMPVGFSFLRMSLKKQEAKASFHLDTDAATALTGEPDTVTQRRVVRLLLNFSILHHRTLAFLDVDPTSLPPSFNQNYVYCPPEAVPQDSVRTIAIPPRAGRLVQGVLFYSSRVYHTGQDDEHGHFVGAYGRED